MKLFKNIVYFIIMKKKYWLIPLVLALLVLSGIIISVEMAPILPAIYPLF